MSININAQGVVTYDTRNVHTISARIGGRLEKVFLKFPFQQVKKGQKIAEIYSPELLTAQRELLYLLENDSKNELMINSSKEKLSLLGVTESQIKELATRRIPQHTFSIYSPYNGYVVPDFKQLPAATANAPARSMDNGMASSSVGSTTSPTVGSATLLREGAYVTFGQTLFTIVNTSALRVELSIPSTLAANLELGGEVILDLGDGVVEQAKIDFIQPFFSNGQEFVTIRVFTRNTDRLHIGHLVSAMLKGDSIEALWIPKEAVLDLGEGNVVFVETNNVLKPKRVVLGSRTKDSVEIKQGLSSTDEIAVNAQYLIDSESFIKTPK